MLAPDEPLPFYVYRHYDRDDTLLYVGMSLSAAERLSQHLKSSPWARDIVTIRIESFPDKESAAHAEMSAIILERPLWNTVFNRGSQKRRKRPAKRFIDAFASQSALAL